MAAADWVIVVILAMSVFSAFRQGFFVASFSLFGLLFGLMVASWNYQRVVPIVASFIPSAPEIAAISFILIALAVMMVCSLIGRLLRKMFHTIGLGWADRLLGAAFGLLRGAIVVTLAVMAIAAFLPHLGWLDHSQLARYFLSAAHQSAVVTPADLGEKIRSGVKMIQAAQPDWLRPHV